MPASLLFICGSLNVGKNGVGDYTRVLASHLQAQGCLTEIIATHDEEVDGIVHERQREAGGAVCVLRISRDITHALRWQAIREQIDVVDPEIISLQFVPFSFDPKGFPRRFIQELAHPALRNRRWHIMFHETWVGSSGGIKSRLLRLGQRWLIKNLYRKLRPVAVHSHLPTYIEDLQQIGIPSSPLPLFANVATGGTNEAIEQVPQGRTFRLAFFSQMDVSSPVAKFIGDLITVVQGTTPDGIEVLLIGGNAVKIAGMRTELAGLFPTLKIIPAGFLSNQELLDRLKNVHLGITPVPFHALGKSGTVAAFLMRRVPVAAPKVTKSNAPFLYPEFNEAILTEFSTEAFLTARRAARDLPIAWITPHRVAINFRKDLQRLGYLSSHHLPENSSCS